MRIKTFLLAGAMAGALVAGPAQAKQGDILLRVRAIMVAPNVAAWQARRRGKRERPEPPNALGGGRFHE